MTIDLQYRNEPLKVDLDKPLDIGLTLKAGGGNPNCYWADEVHFETIVEGDFMGSVARGGSVNHQKITLTPHGNGTHTECYGHIVADPEATLDRCLQRYHFFAELISIAPIPRNGDLVITREQLAAKLGKTPAEALIIRTLPNSSDKILRRYSGTNPPYLEEAGAALLVELGIEHLLVDLPSIDKEVDGGQLLAHHAFWKVPEAPRKHCTITELIYVHTDIKDGTYLLNLQVMGISIDASPSKPILHKMLHR